jgi:hypothetical protein
MNLLYFGVRQQATLYRETGVIFNGSGGHCMSYRRFLLGALLFFEMAAAAETSLPFPGARAAVAAFPVGRGRGKSYGLRGSPRAAESIVEAIKKTVRRITGSHSDGLISLPGSTMKPVKRLTIAGMSQVPC